MRSIPRYQSEEESSPTSWELVGCSPAGDSTVILKTKSGNIELDRLEVYVHERPTATPTPTNTPIPTATNTPTPTATNTPIPTATNTPRPTPTATPTPQLPDKVENFTGAPGINAGEILLDWDPADGATSYEIEQRRQVLGFVYRWFPLPEKAPKNGPWVTFDSATSAVVHGLEGGETYRHRVRGVNSARDGEFSDEEDTTLPLPDPPQNLQAGSLIGNRGVALKWDLVVGVDYGVKVDPMEALHQIDVVGASAKITGLTPDQTYRFFVKGTITFGEGTAASIAHDAPEPTHWWGHQADYTVGYTVGAGAITEPLLETAILAAVAEWNRLMNFNLEICDATDIDCQTENSDGFLVVQHH